MGWITSNEQISPIEQPGMSGILPMRKLGMIGTYALVSSGIEVPWKDLCFGL